jgi:hypothetical protein
MTTKNKKNKIKTYQISTWIYCSCVFACFRNRLHNIKTGLEGGEYRNVTQSQNSVHTDEEQCVKVWSDVVGMTDSKVLSF